MQYLLLRLAVALITFVLGVTTAMIFGAASVSHVRRADSRSIYFGQRELPPGTRSCPHAFGEMPRLPAPPAPPAVLKFSEDKRIFMRLPDGTLRAVESRQSVQGERQF